MIGKTDGDGVTFIEANRGMVLLDALEIINGERQDCYGNPEDSFDLIAKFWSAYLQPKLKIPIHKHDVAMLMSLFKTARIRNGVDHIDSYTTCVATWLSLLVWWVLTLLIPRMKRTRHSRQWHFVV